MGFRRHQAGSRPPVARCGRPASVGLGVLESITSAVPMGSGPRAARSVLAEARNGRGPPRSRWTKCPTERGWTASTYLSIDMIDKSDLAGGWLSCLGPTLRANGASCPAMTPESEAMDRRPRDRLLRARCFGSEGWPQSRPAWLQDERPTSSGPRLRGTSRWPAARTSAGRSGSRRARAPQSYPRRPGGSSSRDGVPAFAEARRPPGCERDGGTAPRRIWLPDRRGDFSPAAAPRPSGRRATRRPWRGAGRGRR